MVQLMTVLAALLPTPGCQEGNGNHQGTWVLVGGEEGGHVLSAEDAKSSNTCHQGEDSNASAGKEQDTWTIARLTLPRNPQRSTFPRPEETTGQVIHAIYVLRAMSCSYGCRSTSANKPDDRRRIKQPRVACCSS